MSIAGTKTAIEISSEPKPKLRVLIVEDNAADGELVWHELQRSGFEVAGEVVQTADEFRQRVKDRVPDIVLADYNLGQWRGIDTLEILRCEGLDIPLILVSGSLGDINAVECIKQGATDYVLKNSLARLPASVRRALQEKKLREERKHTAEELDRKVEQLARSNRDLEQFAYVASHDLQEPLRMVTNYTQLLADRYLGKLDDQADKYIHYAVDGATRMQTLIQDLLAFSRSGRQENGVELTDCNAVIEQTLKYLLAPMQQCGAVVEYDHLPVVLANPSQLQQVFQNLISNGIKFRGEKVPVIQVGAVNESGEWVLSVADNGIGIATEHADSVFAVFTRLHTRTEYPGNGIGLSICKKIIERHGGRIWVSERPEGGCIFNFTLPANEPGPKEKQNNDENH
jgi:signal transduction histidine kinase